MERGMCLKAWMALGLCLAAGAQTTRPVPGNLVDDLRDLVAVPAMPGYEQPLAKIIAGKLAAYHPASDSLGDVLVTVGTGAPHRLLLAAMDEPGYIVSGITPDGYLRLQRLATGSSVPLFNDLYSAEPVMVGTKGGGWISGVSAGLSTHLQAGRTSPPDLNDLDNMYVDIGATSPAQARAAGVDILSPLAIDRQLYRMAGGKLASPAIGDRFGDAALIEVLRHLDLSNLRGSVTFAFVAQQWVGDRGIARVLNELTPDEIVYVGRLTNEGGGRRGTGRGRAGAAPEASAAEPAPGAGVLIVAGSTLASQFSQLASQQGVTLSTAASGSFLPAAGRAEALASAHLSVATAWSSTPAEMLDGNDVAGVIGLVEAYLGQTVNKPSIPAAAALPEPPVPPKPATAPSDTAILASLVAPYGVNPREAPVAEAIKQLLPAWAKPEMDESGNLILQWKDATSASAPRILFVAHQDEVGFDVQSIAPDGRLVLRSRGGGILDYYEGHSILVHTASGMRAGVTELPEGWIAADFRLSGRGAGSGGRGAVHADVGARSADEVAQLGIRAGDTVTIPKKYRKLLGDRATARAFDDRVGDSALISAVWALGPTLPGRNVTFVWSTGEEIGLVGAGAIAKRLAEQHLAPDYVFAIDTFVSSDSPLESQRFADTPIGQGFVIRAVDNSSIAPWPLVQKLESMAKSAAIPVQVGTTGGGNDGSTFLPFGSIDMGLGWPLRYSHSPGEVIDTRDLSSLARVLALAAREWK